MHLVGYSDAAGDEGDLSSRAFDLLVGDAAAAGWIAASSTSAPGYAKSAQRSAVDRQKLDEYLNRFAILKIVSIVLLKKSGWKAGGRRWPSQICRVPRMSFRRTSRIT